MTSMQLQLTAACKEADCYEPLYCRELCQRHYNRDYRVRNRERLRALDRERAQRPEAQEQSRAARKKWRDRYPERHAFAVRKNVLRKRYGLGIADYDRLFKEQDGLCCICRTPLPGISAHVDHDHACCPGRASCGKCVRGLLCGSGKCNRGLSMFDDDPELLRSAAAYLEERKVRPWVT